MAAVDGSQQVLIKADSIDQNNKMEELIISKSKYQHESQYWQTECKLMKNSYEDASTSLIELNANVSLSK